MIEEFFYWYCAGWVAMGMGFAILEDNIRPPAILCLLCGPVMIALIAIVWVAVNFKIPDYDEKKQYLWKKPNQQR